jgi:uncharacterized membrane protein
MKKFGDLGLERLLGRVLRVGVTISSICLGIGLLLALTDAGGGAGAAFLNVGLIALMATPAARVAVSIVEYLIERDWLFAALTTIVGVELAAAVVAALVFHRTL